MAVKRKLSSWSRIGSGLPLQICENIVEQFSAGDNGLVVVAVVVVVGIDVDDDEVEDDDDDVPGWVVVDAIHR